MEAIAGTIDYGNCTYQPNAADSIDTRGRRCYRSHTLLDEETELTPIVPASLYGSHHPFHAGDVIWSSESIQ